MFSKTRQGSSALKKIKEFCLINKKKNNKIRKQQEEEEKCRKDEEEAARQRIEEESEREKETMAPKNLHNIMNGINVPQNAMEVEDEEDDDINERSLLKKQSGSSKTASRRSCYTQVTPPKAMANPPMATSNTKTATFLDTFSYPYPRTIIESAITLKSNKAFEEFTQALMAFITNGQMVDPKFVINPINPTSKEKNISSKGEISPNMTKLGIHIKISGNGNVFNKKKIWNQDQEQKSHRTKKDGFCDPTIYFLMIISTQNPKNILIASHTNGRASTEPDCKSRTYNPLRARWL
jgi:hypothetical protein